MQKIPTLFMRAADHMVVDIVDPQCQWVLDGEGIPTRKWDGTACLIRDGRLYKRLNHKRVDVPPPEGWIHWSFEPHVKHGHGWVPVGDGPEDHLHREVIGAGWTEGTYELCGPGIQKNPEGFDRMVLVRHGAWLCSVPTRTFDGLRDWLRDADIEGIVFHHPDGRMAKIKGRDFGFKRGDKG